MNDDSNNSQNMTIPDGALLQIANNILEILEYPSELENEDDLFLDDFYIVIVGNLMSDRKFDIEPGKTPEEKVQQLNKLIYLLSQIIDMDLSHINAKGIIFDHDRVSAKCLLELLEELIKAIIKQNEEEEENQSEENKNHIQEVYEHSNSLLDSNENKKAQNASDDLINRRKNNLSNENLDTENVNNKESVDDIKISSQKESNEKNTENEEKKTQTKKPEPKPIETKKKTQDNDENSLSGSSLKKTQSCFEELDFKKILKAVQCYENNINESYLRKTYSQNDVSRYEKELAENELANQSNNLGGENIDYGGKDSQINEGEANINVSNISGVDNKIDLSEKKSDEKKVEANNVDDVPELLENSKNNKNYKNFNDDEIDDDSNISLSNNYFDSKQSAFSVPERQKLRLPSTLSDEIEDSSIKNNENFYDNNQPQIDYDVENEKHSSKPSNKSNSKKNSDKKSNNNLNKEKPNKSNNENLTQSDISKSSVQTNQSKKKSSRKNTDKNPSKKNSRQNTSNQNQSSILEELPMDDEEFKYEIMKEFRRLYGNKLDRIFVKNNLQNSHDTLEIILRNIKLARQKMLKIANRIPEPDDLMTKEFMQRYEKELQYILNFYKNEKKKRNIFQERALKNLSQNVRVMKKIQEIQTRKMEDEIERRRKAREYKNHQNQLKLCNEIYSKALQLEKEKYLEEISNQMELRRIENEEKRKAMMEIEKYYTDKIAILKEILRREKREREIEHRAKIKFLSQLERDRKGEFKKQIDEVFQKFDEEDKKAEFEDNNQEEIEKILNNYYKK